MNTLYWHGRGSNDFENMYHIIVEEILEHYEKPKEISVEYLPAELLRELRTWVRSWKKI